MLLFVDFLEEYSNFLHKATNREDKDFMLQKFLSWMDDHQSEFPAKKFEQVSTCPQEKLRVTTNAQGNKVIPFLEEFLVATYESVYDYVPSLYINGDLVRGLIKGDIAASAVCDSFEEVPESCTDLTVNLKNLSQFNQMSNNVGGILVIVVACFMLFFLTFILYKKVMMGQVKKDMTEMVNYHLERYQ